jgi:NAD(P)-dependent dehydrogenase (short-subunit alcohol dehydrogenase family)
MKNILIIGGSNGIGKALANMLAEDHTVIASFFKSETKHPHIHYFYHNAQESLNLDALPETIDGLAYCVGNISLKPFHRFTEEDYLQDYKTQVIGAVKVIQDILPRLKLSASSSIVLFSTVAVQTGFNFHSLISASKGAIEGLTKALAAELAPKIRVNCIAPSITQTPLVSSLLNTEEKITANGQRHPLGRIGQAEDVASLAAFLLSDSSSWITGQIIHVDGGISTLKK